MAYYEVKVSDEPSVVIGGDDASISLKISARRTGPVKLSATGIRRLATGDEQHLDWIERSLAVGDRVLIALRPAGTAAKPMNSQVMDPRDLERELHGLHDQIQHKRSASERKSKSSESMRSVSFKVTVKDEVVIAPLGEHEQLMLSCRTSAGWKLGELELVSQTLTQRANTHTTRWFTYELGMDDELLIAVGS